MKTSQSFGILARAAAGDPDAEQEAMTWVMRGLRTYFRARGELSLERALGLPSIKAARRVFLVGTRDYWLTVAHGLCDGATAWKRSVSLAIEMESFCARIWPEWQLLDDPPAGTSLLRTALFNAMQAARELTTAKGMPFMPATPRQFHEIVKRKADETSLAAADTEVPTPHEDPEMPTPTPEQHLALDILATWRSDPAVRAQFGTVAAYADHREAQASKQHDEVKS